MSAAKYMILLLLFFIYPLKALVVEFDQKKSTQKLVVHLVATASGSQETKNHEINFQGALLDQKVNAHVYAYPHSAEIWTRYLSKSHSVKPTQNSKDLVFEFYFQASSAVYPEEYFQNRPSNSIECDFTLTGDIYWNILATDNQENGTGVLVNWYPEVNLGAKSKNVNYVHGVEKYEYKIMNNTEGPYKFLQHMAGAEPYFEIVDPDIIPVQMFGMVGSSIHLSFIMKGKMNTKNPEELSYYFDPVSSSSIIRFKQFLSVEQFIHVSFWDKAQPTSKVKGAAADGKSEVIIKIENLPEDITDPKKIAIAIQENEDDKNGHLLDDGKIENKTYTRTYVSPEYFVRNKNLANDDFYKDTDIYQGKREIKFDITIGSKRLSHPAFFLIKVPIVLLHGLWGLEDTWKKFGEILRKNHGYNYIENFLYLNSSSHFDELNGVIGKAISNALNLAKDAGFVAKQADIVAHSMGGLLTKLYGKAETIHSITTVGTPHFGSPFADGLWMLVNLGDGGKLAARILDITNHPATKGAIEDLRVNGGKHCKADAIPVPICVIAGISPLTEPEVSALIQIASFLYKWNGLLSLTSSIFDFHDIIFLKERSDWVVSESSQKGGVTGQIDYVLWHGSEPEDKEIWDKIIHFLHRTSYREVSVEMPTVQTPDLSKLQSLLDQNRLEYSAGEVEFISPLKDQNFNAGEMVPVEIKVTGAQKDALLIIVNSNGDSVLLEKSPYTWQFKAPDNIVGPFYIIAGARENKNFIGQAEVAINISTRAFLKDIKLSPERDTLYLAKRNRIPLTLYGVYSDGVSRKIQLPEQDTEFHISNPDVVKISSHGILTAKEPGESVVTVKKSSFVKKFTVFVSDHD